MCPYSIPQVVSQVQSSYDEEMAETRRHACPEAPQREVLRSLSQQCSSDIAKLHCERETRLLGPAAGDADDSSELSDGTELTGEGSELEPRLLAAADDGLTVDDLEDMPRRHEAAFVEESRREPTS